MADQRPIVTEELRIVDAEGRARLVLSAEGGAPAFLLLREDGRPGATVSLDAAGRPAVRLNNPDGDGLAAVLEIDDKGAHVKFDRPGGASCYLFLNNAGASGVVLLDAAGRRRLNVMVAPDGASRIEQFDEDGNPRG